MIAHDERAPDPAARDLAPIVGTAADQRERLTLPQYSCLLAAASRLVIEIHVRNDGRALLDRGLLAAWVEVLIGLGTFSFRAFGSLPGGSYSHAHKVPDWPPSVQVFLAQPKNLVAFQTT